MILRLLFVGFLCLGFITGCSVIDVRAKIDPAGGALTDSIACVYDFDRDGLWYVVFIREEGLLAAVHRHNPGIHLFLDNGDVLFFCRCSGRGEVIDIMSQTFSLKRGSVFLCEVDHGAARVRQLRMRAPPCNGDDPESISKAVYDLADDAQIGAFLGPESQARLRAEWEMTRDKKRTP